MSEEKKPAERRESKSKHYMIPVRKIVANTNPRNPLSNELQKQGWTVFEVDKTLLDKTKAVWPLAVSENPEDRKKFVELMQGGDPEFVGWAATFMTQGQLQAVEVRDNGNKAEGGNTYTLVYGCRRCLAILYNWCLTGKPAEPVVEAKLAKGNNVSLLHRAVVENTRRQPNAMEEAQAIQLALNAGQTKEEVAREYGVTLQTVQNRLDLLSLPPKAQQRIKDGKLKPTKALSMLRAGEGEKAGDEPQAGAEPPAPRERMRNRKDIEAALGEFAEATIQHKVLAWVLGKADNFR